MGLGPQNQKEYGFWALVPYWGPSGAYWGLSGAYWGPSGAYWGPSRAYWGLSGTYWGLPGAYSGPSGAYWGPSEAYWGLSGPIRPSWDAQATLGRLIGHIGGAFGPCNLVQFLLGSHVLRFFSSDHMLKLWVLKTHRIELQLRDLSNLIHPRGPPGLRRRVWVSS